VTSLSAALAGELVNVDLRGFPQAQPFRVGSLTDGLCLNQTEGMPVLPFAMG
jgi:hypothetical protein